MVGELLNYIKDVSVILGGLTLVWKVVSFLQAATKTAKRIPTFMDETSESLCELRNFAHLAVTNHLSHIQDHLETIAEKKD